VVGVPFDPCKRIPEDGARFPEVDAVFPEVGTGLPAIPRKIDFHASQFTTPLCRSLPLGSDAVCSRPWVCFFEAATHPLPRTVLTTHYARLDPASRTRISTTKDPLGLTSSRTRWGGGSLCDRLAMTYGKPRQHPFLTLQFVSQTESASYGPKRDSRFSDLPYS
jgi:hypothetical protein